MNNIGRYCDYRGCYKEHTFYMIQTFGEFFINGFSCEDHKKELMNTFFGPYHKTVWIVAWEDNTGGEGFDLRHICATEELAKKKLNDCLLEIYDEIPQHDHGWYYEEKEIETV